MTRRWVIRRRFCVSILVVYCVRNVVAHGDAREGKWRGNWRIEWLASTLTRPRNVVYPALLTLMPTPRLPAVDWTDSPADLNGLVRLGERRNVVSARVPSGSARALTRNFSVLQSGRSLWVLASFPFKGYFGLYPRDYSGRISKVTSHLQQFCRLMLTAIITPLSSGDITAVAQVPFGLYVDNFNLILPTKFSTKYRNLLWHYFYTRDTSAVAFTWLDQAISRDK